ncbi:MAG: hypothetical protein M1483_03340 [Actinobacteria bacterium]|nr:hypothetical protein [Actinomycetota bacterium]MCL6104660.1 hypothetical protein [Actinomycetota bacterium]
MDILEIIRELKRDEALREEMRAILLTEELRALPEAFARLEESVAQLARRINETETAFDKRMTETETAFDKRMTEMETAFDKRMTEMETAFDKRMTEMEMASDKRMTEMETASDRRMTRLEEGQARLEEGQARLEEGQARLEEGQASLRTEVGRLSQIVGGTVEDDASSVIVTVLERKGWRFLSEPTSAQVNGEIDVLARVEDPDGNGATVIIEAKTRLRPADVRRFAANLDGLLVDVQVAERCFAYVYGLRIYDGAVDAARELGLGVLCPDGERAPAVERASAA